MNHINYLAYPYQERVSKLNLALELAKGNLDDELYQPYKNYRIALLNNNNIQVRLCSLIFCLVDLNLYLDLHPNDKEALSLYHEFRKEFNEVKKDYEALCGPLTILDVNNQLMWSYLDKWPWERGEK